MTKPGSPIGLAAPPGPVRGVLSLSVTGRTLTSTIGEHMEAEVGALCLVCGSTRQTFEYRDRILCPRCAISACGVCWKAYPVMKFAKVPWRIGHYRIVCPSCKWKSRWMS
jgi:hypothetical protein